MLRGCAFSANVNWMRIVRKSAFLIILHPPSFALLSTYFMRIYPSIVIRARSTAHPHHQVVARMAGLGRGLALRQLGASAALVRARASCAPLAAASAIHRNFDGEIVYGVVASRALCGFFLHTSSLFLSISLSLFLFLTSCTYLYILRASV
jgi:hypothetical protein